MFKWISKAINGLCISYYESQLDDLNWWLFEYDRRIKKYTKRLEYIKSVEKSERKYFDGKLKYYKKQLKK